MSSMRFSACLNTFHHGSLYLFKDARVVEDSVTGIHNAAVKHLFVVSRSSKVCLHLSVTPYIQRSGLMLSWVWYLLINTPLSFRLQYIYAAGV
jgi:hypothetical protein